jgi:hypothetical protein
MFSDEHEGDAGAARITRMLQDYRVDRLDVVHVDPAATPLDAVGETAVIVSVRE